MSKFKSNLLFAVTILLPVLCFSAYAQVGVAPSRQQQQGNAIAAYVFGAENSSNAVGNVQREAGSGQNNDAAITAQAVEKFCKEFINYVINGKLNKALAYFNADYVRQQHDNFLEGRTEQFIREFLAGLTPAGDYVYPGNIADIKSIQILETSANPYDRRATAIFEMELKSGVKYSVNATLVIDEANRMGFMGAAG